MNEKPVNNKAIWHIVQDMRAVLENRYDLSKFTLDDIDREIYEWLISDELTGVVELEDLVNGFADWAKLA